MARAAATPHHSGLLPEEIVIWEILVRLPPKTLLRCRAVCGAWRRATSARDFLLAHHARQPDLPIMSHQNHDGRSFIAFDNRATAAQLQPVARLDGFYCPTASCDGLLLLCDYGSDILTFSVCNPATRQFAQVPMLSGFVPLGMYRHGPTGEYRILVCPETENPATGEHVACYIFALGSVQPLRNIGWLPEAWLQGADETSFSGVEAVLFRGSLHWHLEQHERATNMITVFDTTAESFRQMHGPAVYGLFEMGGILGMACSNDEGKIISFWMMEDYESEVWVFKYRVELPIEEIKVQCDMRHIWLHRYNFLIVVVPADGELPVLVRCDNWLFQIDMDGKLVASFYREDLCLTRLQLKQTLVLHTFFPALEGYVVNAPPFI